MRVSPAPHLFSFRQGNLTASHLPGVCKTLSFHPLITFITVNLTHITCAFCSLQYFSLWGEYLCIIHVKINSFKCRVGTHCVLEMKMSFKPF